MLSSPIPVLLPGEPYTTAPPIGHFYVAKIGHYHVGATEISRKAGDPGSATGRPPG